MKTNVITNAKTKSKLSFSFFYKVLPLLPLMSAPTWALNFNLAEFVYSSTGIEFKSYDNLNFGTYHLLARVEIFDSTKVQVKAWLTETGSGEDGYECHSVVEALVGNVKLALTNNSEVFDTQTIPIVGHYLKAVPKTDGVACEFEMGIDWHNLPMNFWSLARNGFYVDFPKLLVRKGYTYSGVSFSFPTEQSARNWKLNLTLKKPEAGADLFKYGQKITVQNPKINWSLSPFENPLKIYSRISSYTGKGAVFSESSQNLELPLRGKVIH